MGEKSRTNFNIGWERDKGGDMSGGMEWAGAQKKKEQKANEEKLKPLWYSLTREQKIDLAIRLLEDVRRG